MKYNRGRIGAKARDGQCGEEEQYHCELIPNLFCFFFLLHGLERGKSPARVWCGWTPFSVEVRCFSLTGRR
jgi:hypothetical protein